MKRLLLNLRHAASSKLDHLKRRHLQRPKLEIQILPGRKSYITQKSNRNIARQGLAPAYIYETCLAFRIVIRNRSDFDAYYPKIKFDRVLPHGTRLDILNHYVPIPAGGLIVLHGEYKVLASLRNSSPRLTTKPPQEFAPLKVLLSYRNEARNRFYTCFDVGFQINTFYRFKPSDFE
jgi:hypothetical protein